MIEKNVVGAIIKFLTVKEKGKACKIRDDDDPFMFGESPTKADKQEYLEKHNINYPRLTNRRSQAHAL